MTYYTLAGLLMLSGALVGFVDLIRPVHYARTPIEKTADQTGRRFTHAEVLDERKTTR